MWAVGGGFWLKIEPLSFSPFASFFVWQALATAAIQVASKMKENCVCCYLALDAWDNLHDRFVFSHNSLSVVGVLLIFF